MRRALVASDNEDDYDDDEFEFDADEQEPDYEAEPALLPQAHPVCDGTVSVCSASPCSSAQPVVQLRVSEVAALNAVKQAEEELEMALRDIKQGTSSCRSAIASADTLLMVPHTSAAEADKSMPKQHMPLSGRRAAPQPRPAPFSPPTRHTAAEMKAEQPSPLTSKAAAGSTSSASSTSRSNATPATASRLAPTVADRTKDQVLPHPSIGSSPLASSSSAASPRGVGLVESLRPSSTVAHPVAGGAQSNASDMPSLSPFKKNVRADAIGRENSSSQGDCRGKGRTRSKDSGGEGSGSACSGSKSSVGPVETLSVGCRGNATVQQSVVDVDTSPKPAVAAAPQPESTEDSNAVNSRRNRTAEREIRGVATESNRKAADDAAQRELAVETERVAAEAERRKKADDNARREAAAETERRKQASEKAEKEAEAAMRVAAVAKEKREKADAARKAIAARVRDKRPRLQDNRPSTDLWGIARSALSRLTRTEAYQAAARAQLDALAADSVPDERSKPPRSVVHAAVHAHAKQTSESDAAAAAASERTEGGTEAGDLEGATAAQRLSRMERQLEQLTSLVQSLTQHIFATQTETVASSQQLTRVESMLHRALSSAGIPVPSSDDGAADAANEMGKRGRAPSVGPPAWLASKTLPPAHPRPTATKKRSPKAQTSRSSEAKEKHSNDLCLTMAPVVKSPKVQTWREAQEVLSFAPLETPGVEPPLEPTPPPEPRSEPPPHDLLRRGAGDALVDGATMMLIEPARGSSPADSTSFTSLRATSPVPVPATTGIGHVSEGSLRRRTNGVDDPRTLSSAPWPASSPSEAPPGDMKNGAMHSAVKQPVTSLMNLLVQSRQQRQETRSALRDEREVNRAKRVPSRGQRVAPASRQGLP